MTDDDTPTVAVEIHVPVKISTVRLNRLNLDVHHEFDGAGNHRLRVGRLFGDWARYQDFAVAEFTSVRFIASTYYFSGVLPEVFEIITIKEHDPIQQQEPSSEQR